MSKVMLMSAFALVFVLSGASLVLAEDVTCPPSIFLRTVDNVIVNGPCQIGTGATVRGNVKIVEGGDLAVFGPSTIGGNVQSEGGERFIFFTAPVRIEGNLQATRTARTSGYMTGTTHIGGSVLYQGNSGNLILDSGVVEGNVQVFDNSTRDPSIISGNVIGGNLQCAGNTPPPISRAPNVVAGNKEGQCSGPGF